MCECACINHNNCIISLLWPELEIFIFYFLFSIFCFCCIPLLYSSVMLYLINLSTCSTGTNFCTSKWATSNKRLRHQKKVKIVHLTGSFKLLPIFTLDNMTKKKHFDKSEAFVSQKNKYNSFHHHFLFKSIIILSVISMLNFTFFFEDNIVYFFCLFLSKPCRDNNSMPFNLVGPQVFKQKN